MQQSLIVVDDFLSDPHAVRRAGLAQEFPALDEPSYFPGRNSKHRQVLNGLDERISNLLGERVAPVDGTGHGKFRIALEGEEGTAGVHIDKAHWSGMLYLSLPEDCQGGTEFYRHIPTGTDRAPFTLDECKAMGFPSMDALWQDLIWSHTNDKSKWDHLFTVPMRFNRLVLFRPQQWHDSGISFGDTPENGRLIYMMFYQSV